MEKTEEVLAIFYRIDILSRFGVLERYINSITSNKETGSPILLELRRKNFFKCSQVELYFLYLSLIHIDSKDLKKDY